ncbi:MAG: hypothetical protein ACYC96_13065 [Fimbriimonadaceae bacterium]
MGLRTVAMLLAAGATVAGCNKERIPFLGHWDGGFDVTSTTASVPTTAIVLRGYIQLYRTNDRFLMEMANPLQLLDLAGNWRMVSSTRIELTFHNFKLTEPDLEKLKAMHKPYLDPVALRAAYTKPLILDLSPNGKQLTGLLVRVGPLLGTHVFRKGQ